jgi:dephospho-CoA kinase
MNIIGVTGGIGAGKSTVCKVFKTLGVPVFDSDSQVKRLYEERPVIDLVSSVLGQTFLINDKLDLKKIGQEAFQNPKLLLRLNELIHPLIQQRFKQWCDFHKESDYVIKEAAIMIESGTYKDCTDLVLVMAPLENRIENVMKRSSLSRLEVLNRINAQLTDDQRQAYCKYSIINNESVMLLPQVLKLHEVFRGIRIN